MVETTTTRLLKDLKMRSHRPNEPADDTELKGEEKLIITKTEKYQGMDVGKNYYGGIVKVDYKGITLWPNRFIAEENQPVAEAHLDIIKNLIEQATSIHMTHTNFLARGNQDAASRLVGKVKSNGFLTKIWILAHPENATV